jgi:hypothetical protein
MVSRIQSSRAKFYSHSHNTVIRIYDEAGNTTERHRQKRSVKSGHHQSSERSSGHLRSKSIERLSGPVVKSSASLIISDREILFASAPNLEIPLHGRLKVNAFERFSVGDQQLNCLLHGAVKSTRFQARESSILYPIVLLLWLVLIQSALESNRFVT